MAETTEKKITLSNFFEQIVEINKISRQALEKSNQSVSISEKTRLDLEKLIKTLEINFDDKIEVVNNEDKVEDLELRDSFSLLQKNFDNLALSLTLMESNLNALTKAFEADQLRKKQFNKQSQRQLDAQQDKSQKGLAAFLGGGGATAKAKTEQTQDKNKSLENVKKSLKQFLAGAALTGVGGALAMLSGPLGDGGGGGGVDAGDVIADTAQEKSLIATVREREGTAGAQGYNTFFGGSQYGGDLSKKTVTEVAELQKKFESEGRGRFYNKGTGKWDSSAAVGVGQFMTPETVVRDMGLDPSKEKFTPELQNKMILFLARRRGIDPSKELNERDLEILSKEWSGFSGAAYGQNTNTIKETLRIYRENLKEAKAAQVRSANEAAESGQYGRYADPDQQQSSVLTPEEKTSFIASAPRETTQKVDGIKPPTRTPNVVELPPIVAGAPKPGVQPSRPPSPSTDSIPIGDSTSTVSAIAMLESRLHNQLQVPMIS